LTAASERLRVGLRHELWSPDGSDVGIFETNRTDWSVGDEFIVDGNRLYRIMDMIPRPLVDEFVDEPFYEAWEVQPVEWLSALEEAQPALMRLPTRRPVNSASRNEA
jgi:hypothetical protein